MKAKYIIMNVLILVVLLAGANRGYACTPPPNQNPVAVLAPWREYVILGRNVILDGSGSYDPDADGRITKYQWDFTDNGSYDYSETANSYGDGKFDGITTHVYDSEGTCWVRLQVTDNESGVDNVNDCNFIVSVDSDNDDLPDGWELDYWPHLWCHGPEDDPDSDGYNNLSEFLHGSNPKMPSKVPNPSNTIMIYVPGDANSVQRAINASIDGETVVVSKGTHYGSIDFDGKEITVRSTDPNNWQVVASTIIDANDSDANVITFKNSEDASSALRGLIITGGGRGIYCNGTSPIISNCVITDNYDSSNGGGIYDNNSSPTVRDCFFSENDANCGGGMYNIDSSPTVTNCVFSENSANSGAGIYDLNSSPVMTNCTFTENYAADDGGAMFNSGASSNPLVTNCIFWGNNANGSGDEIYNENSADPNFSYCDISGSGGSSSWDPNFGIDDGGNIDEDPMFVAWDPTDDIISHWKFDEGSGTIAYDSAGDNDGTLVNGPNWTSGQIGGALSFDGVDDYVSCGTGPAITGTGTFTASAWVKTESTDGQSIVVQRSPTSPNGSYGFGVLSSGKIQFHIYNNGYGFIFQSSVTVNDGLWHHIVVFRTNSTDGEIYVDGSPAGSGSGPAKSLNSVPVWIGGRSFTVPCQFNGLIDDVRIYDRALLVEEIAQLYQNGLSGFAGPDGIFGTSDDGLRLQLDPNNPCIDAANGNAAPTADILGWDRVDNNDVNNTGTGDPNYADMGAYEALLLRIFVDVDATGRDNGTSWADAFDDLQEAFSYASDGVEIWVAEGIYKPTDGNDRTISFQLVEGVALYGGFEGSETTRDQRDWVVNETILSGGIGTLGDANDNSYNVVRGAEGAVLDGFTITGGKADGGGEFRYGGGMYNYNCTPEVRNCTFRNNYAELEGGAISNRGAGSDITVTGCVFKDNKAGDYGGAIANWAAGPAIEGCFFIGNEAARGGGIYNYDVASGQTNIINSVFYENSATYGGGVYNYMVLNNNQPSLTNCTFNDNTATYGNSVRNMGSNPKITNCIMWNDPEEGAEISNTFYSNPTVTYCDIKRETVYPGEGNKNVNPEFVDANNPAGSDGVFYTIDDGLRQDANSPCIDAADGNTAPETDIVGWGRIDDDVNNTGTGDPNYADMGAYEFFEYNVTGVRVYTSSDYSDNDGNGLNDCQVHFGHKDGTGDYAYPNLYIEIDLSGGDSAVEEQIKLRVTSSSDSSGIRVMFYETGVNTNTYRTSTPIHLATARNQNTLELKVRNEDRLYVDGVAGPKVDRGEVATITADVTPDAPQYMADDGADRFEEFFDKDEGSSDPFFWYFWWEGGEERALTTAVFPAMVKLVGWDSWLSAPADFIFECSHGSNGNFGYGTNLIHKPGGGSPTITSYNWKYDIEWAVFYSCMVLGTWNDRDAYTRYWDDALIRQPNQNNCHGILASSYLLIANFTAGHMSIFCNAMKGNGSRVIDAYMDPGFWNTAALFHLDNVDDYLNNVTPDTNDPSMYYTYYIYYEGPYEQTWSLGDEGNQDASETNPEVAEFIELADAVLEGLDIAENARKRAKVVCAIPPQRPLLYRALVLKESPRGKPFDAAGFDISEFDGKGQVHFKKHLRERGPIRLSKAQARAKADNFITQKGGGMPADAELTAVIQQMVKIYDARDPENTQNEYVRKGFFEYTHKFNGIEIVGGNRGDSILVGIELDGTSRLKRHWRNVVGPTGGSQEVIPGSEALGVAVENIPRVILLPPDVEYQITEIKLFYYGLPSEEVEQALTPAWGFELDNSLWVYVDAFTGEFLK